MALRGFLVAFWTLVIVAVLALYGVVHYALPFILAMVDKHPLVMDAINYTAPAWVIWGCD